MTSIPTYSGLSFGEAVRSVFGKYATFTGRATRSEYWFWTLFQVIISTVFGILISVSFFWAFGASLASAANSSTETVAPDAAGLTVFIISTVLLGIWWLATLLPNLAVTVRRFHDAGYTGWLWFLNLIPSVGSFIVLVFMVLPSTIDANQFGAAPIKR